MDGICTLANDYVYDQLVALLNSIEAIAGIEMPVCVYPYDANTDRIAAEIARRPQVTLYDDADSIQTWDRFVRDAWDCHPTARQRWDAADGSKYHRVGTHRRYCAFDGPFDRFLYMDADTLLMGPVAPIFAQLDTADWVVYDYQYKDPSHVYDLPSEKLTQVFSPARIETEIFCSGFYAAKRGLFEQSQREWLLQQLRAGEAEVLYPLAPDQTLLNYMVMRSGISYCNMARQLPPNAKTGCCVTSPHFEEKDHILYDRGRRLTYVHYIGVSAKLFARLCAGENLKCPYRDLFLYYRYLHQPDQRPQFTGKPKLYDPPPSLVDRALKKIGLTR
ncbi:MAG: sugar transferase [Cyanothece sp. SIO1E1]|nr:sugar transferase [Cyanothece sp. SIO1E1]